ncbi:MAG: Galactoside transport system permease protein MglC [Firmicutes bacterium ADurb.Bin248]|nr:MAG: Galactoside transport system permease protein MglC [Firmicutes bacterium ADurb.Bin248]HPK14440.1 beta-methylgalactoside transporter [Clostridia bacterium]
MYVLLKPFKKLFARLMEKKRAFDALDARDKKRYWGDFLLNNAIYIVLVILVIYVEIVTLTNAKFATTFLSFESIIDIMKKAASASFLALGVGGIIVLTGTDLSAGRIMGLSMLVSASLLQKPFAEYTSKMFPDMAAPPIVLVILLVMAVSCVIGIFNGFFVAKFSLHPFIVTLATQLMLYGLILIYMSMGNNGGAPIAGLTEEYKQVVKGTLTIFNVAIPYYVFYAIVAIAVMWFIWNKTTFGKCMYAVGANPEAANVSGVNVMKTIVFVFALAGILYGFSGFIEAARVGSNNASAGLNAELDAIAACVIGGVSFTGGTGKISGIITGVILLQIITVALQWLNVSTNLQYIIKGAIILMAVAIDMRKYLTKK